MINGFSGRPIQCTKVAISSLLLTATFFLVGCVYTNDRNIPEQDNGIFEYNITDAENNDPDSLEPEPEADGGLLPEKIAPYYDPAPTPTPPHRSGTARYDPLIQIMVNEAENVSSIPFEDWWAERRVFTFPDELPPSQLILMMDEAVYPAYTPHVSATLTFSFEQPYYRKSWIQEAYIVLLRQVGDEWHKVLMTGWMAFLPVTSFALDNDSISYFMLHEDRLVGDQFTPGTYRFLLNNVSLRRTDGAPFNYYHIYWSWCGMLWAEFTVE